MSIKLSQIPHLMLDKKECECDEYECDCLDENIDKRIGFNEAIDLQCEVELTLDEKEVSNIIERCRWEIARRAFLSDEEIFYSNIIAKSIAKNLDKILICKEKK